jgi:hypothetical protein
MERNYVEDLSMDGRITLKWVGMELIVLAPDWER